VLPGPNGKIVFTSGRGAPANDDNTAQLYTIGPSGGAVTKITGTGSQFAGAQEQEQRHSHPSWSPDRRRIVYTRGPAASDKDIWIKNVVQGGAVNITISSNVNEDRAVFSPDGTKIAYSSEITDGSGQTDILVVSLNANGNPTGTPINLTSSPGEKEERPEWSPDGSTIYFARGDVSTNASGIYKRVVSNQFVLPTQVIDGAGVSEYQPALAPDGKKLCYTRGLMSSQADVYTVSLNAQGVARGTPVNLSDNAGADPGDGGINCEWSPDGKRIAYVRGVFGNGALAVEDASDLGTAATLSDVASHFDGNPSWAPNPAPTCAPVARSVAFQGFVDVPLSCTDPAPESSNTTKSIVTGPANGTLGPITQGQPATVTYTPNAGFSGTDTFTYRASDGNSQGPPATVTITVLPKAADPPPPPPGDPGQPPDRRAAVLSSLSLSPKTFRVGKKLAKFSGSPVGTTISFRLDERAATTLTFERILGGRRVGSRCLKATRARRNLPRCKRYVAVGSLRQVADAGLRKVRFQGRLSTKRRLAPGAHRVVVGATDQAGNVSRPLTSSTFTVVAR
jgi:Tol biopolymer transport system component